MLAFWLVNIYYVVQVHLNYGIRNLQFYVAIPIINLLYPVIWMILSKIIKGLLQLIQQNQELVDTIKNMLEVLPEGVIIEGKDKPNDHVLVRYANRIATQDLFDGQWFEGKSINSNQTDAIIKLNSSLGDGSISSEDPLQSEDNQYTFHQLLEAHRAKIDQFETKVNSIIELVQKNPFDETYTSEYYHVKCIRVRWNKDSDSYMHVFSNITCAKRLEKERAINKCLNMMFSSVSHEFRTPINAFSNAINLLEINFDSVNNMLKKNGYLKGNFKTDYEKMCLLNQKYLKIGKISAKLLLNLTEDILDLAKMEAGMFRLNENLFLISDLVEDINYIFTIQCEQKDIYFRFQVEDNLLNYQFRSDVGRIKQILMNLISNSLKFTNKGGITVTIQIANNLNKDHVVDRYLHFSVTDTGIGISK